MRIAVLGTGIMGRAMAANLDAAGHDVVVWNRTRSRAEGIGDAVVADGPVQAVADADAVVTMLVDADTVAQVMDDEVLAAMRGVPWLQMTTVGSEVDRLADIAARADVPFVDAPVAGTRQPAIDGTLTVLAAGPSAVRDVADEVFDVVGSRTVWLGEASGPASRMKLVVNGILVTQSAAIAEGIVAAEAHGLDAARLLAALEGGPLGSAVTLTKGRAMLDDTSEPQFPLEHATKDARLGVAAAADAGVDLPVLEAVERVHQRAVDAGHARSDMAAVIEGLRP